MFDKCFLGPQQIVIVLHLETCASYLLHSDMWYSI